MYPVRDPAVPAVSPVASAMPKAQEAIAPPTVFTEFVSPVATPVCVGGAAAAAVAGSAPTRAPDPMPATTMLTMTCA